MPETAAEPLAGNCHTDGLQAAHARPARVLVWAEDERQSEVAIDASRHGLWPLWFRFKIGDNEQLPLGLLCPLRDDDLAVLECVRRERWMWVLVPQRADTEAVATCV